MAQNETDKFPHILLKDTALTEPYTPIPSRGKTFKLPPRDRKEHGHKLLRQFEQLRHESDQLIKEQKAYGIDAGNGIYVQFESDPEFELKFESLEALRSGIELLAVQTVGGKTLATVFVPEGKLDILTKKVADYLEKDTSKGLPRNRDLVESVGEIQRAALEALWTDDKALFPEADDQEIWWEVWLRSGDDPDGTVQFFKEHAEHIGITVSGEVIRFPDRTVVAAHGTKAQMSQSVKLLNCVAELRMTKETADFFTAMDAIEQREWMEDLRDRVTPPSGDFPVACLLDTGVNRAHPLLIDYLDDSDMHAYDPSWNITDHQGHGTEMAGLALYGDLVEVLTGAGPVQLTHNLESVKILPPRGQNPPHLYGDITAESIARAEVQNPVQNRVVCLTVSATDDRDRGRPSSWSARIDNLCSGSDDDFQRLVVVAAGNTPADDRHHYPHSNMSDFGIHDPGQSWNAITVGAFTEKGQIDPAEYPGWSVIAPISDLSPCSSTSMTWQRPWPTKPDVVFEGGNMAINPVDGNADYMESLQLLSTYFRHTIKPFVTTGDTSAATALATRMAAVLMAQYPDYWPETIRALLVHSAEWTEKMLERFSPQKKKDYENLLRYSGYGVPDLNRALWSAENTVTLIAQDSLQPFEKRDSRYVTRDLNLHQIPWPAEVLQELGETEVEMRVTLSYFIESNPARRGWGRKYSYASHGLRFDVKRPLERLDAFRQRINQKARDEERGRSTESPADTEWVLGPNLRKHGSIHSDTWRGTAASLAERGYVAVYPVIGWWRESPRHQRWNKRARYSLVVSIRSPETDVELYSAVQNIIRQPVEILIS
ncbi:MAG: S8 family peptidase [Thermodesulfobacteriota bacterium]|nr:S8 family peptidase [Thermodesulfobacteriota bacterium]